MDAKDNPKLQKPLSSRSLKRELNSDPYTYREIADCCILLATGLDEDQRDEAREKLEEWVPAGGNVYVAVGRISNRRLRKRYSVHRKDIWRYGTKELAWTYENATCWQHVTGIAPNVRTLKLDDRLHYFSMN